VRSEAAGQRGMTSVSELLEQRLKPKVNLQISAFSLSAFSTVFLSTFPKVSHLCADMSQYRIDVFCNLCESCDVIKENQANRMKERIVASSSGQKSLSAIAENVKKK
jgi:hypothetical protein